MPSWMPCLRFSLGELESATNDFASENLKHYLHYGKLYSGSMSGTSYSGEVSVVRFDKMSGDVDLMFENEIKVFGAHHHVNIISLVGFCNDEDEKILVYEFMPGVTLRDYFHGKHTHHLTVEQRLKICLGVANGLSYHHYWTDFNVLHDNISPGNILLDASLVPKISRFHERSAYYHDSPPERYGSGVKADVYCFGVVLLEILCEREPWNRLLVLSLPSIMKGELPKCTPEHVKKNITPACARQCEKLIMKCLEYEPDKRPSMNQVVQYLELALVLQKDQRHINFQEQSSGMNKRCKSFSLDDIRTATDEFSKTLGEGAFGKVYFGKISDNGNDVDVAAKCMSTDPEQGIPAFELEIKLLSACDHVNIISLVGFCDEKDAKILVYEFMLNGSLYDYLYERKDDTLQLTLEQRLEICLGVAKGLAYLHSRNDYNIIHSDLKTDNILLDANLVPKISDFGLSRIRAVGPSTSSLITNHIKGTLGYIAPECYEPNYKLSRKADVYAFGVILLEVICEKPAWERLVIWALPFVSKGELPKFTPKNVVKNISPECTRACANLIRDCLEIDPNNRPCMSHVIANLDLALALQKMNKDRNSQMNETQVTSLKTFSFSDIEMATNEFAPQNLLQEENFWRRRTCKVYRGNISIDVALKHMTRKADQVFGFNRVHHSSLFQEFNTTFQKEIKLFQNEIDSLSACHHANVISLLGCCNEPDEKILIYEFMHNGSLHDHLRSEQGNTIHLTVEQRLTISLGVAKGLCFLHSSNIVHGYLNSKSILLDHNLTAKISNFKFSKRCVTGLSTLQENTHIIGRTDVMERYLAPECNQFKYHVSQEADVYAFAVIFLEVLCENTTMKNLLTLAFPFIMRGELAIFTPKLGTYISGECARACENLLRDCLESNPDKRVFMNQVVEKLESALKLQKEGANW